MHTVSAFRTRFHHPVFSSKALPALFFSSGIWIFVMLIFFFFFRLCFSFNLSDYKLWIRVTWSLRMKLLFVCFESKHQGQTRYGNSWNNLCISHCFSFNFHYKMGKKSFQCCFRFWPFRLYLSPQSLVRTGNL